MEIKEIKTQEEYNNAIAYLETIGDREGFEENPELIKQFELISTLVDLYEKDKFPINAAHPLEIIKLKMQMMGILQKDLVPLIGTSGVVSDVFNKRRGMSKAMIRNFSELLHIDQDIININYDLEQRDPRIIKNPKEKLSPFEYIGAMHNQVEAFKRRVRKNGMLFNINAV